MKKPLPAASLSDPTKMLVIHSPAHDEAHRIVVIRNKFNLLDRFVALEPAKCALVYLLLLATKAGCVVEAGTSFGVSTIYLALAVGQNTMSNEGVETVIATENKLSKAKRAREHWKRAGVDVEKWIDLREGDLLQTLQTGLQMRSILYYLTVSTRRKLIIWTKKRQN